MVIRPDMPRCSSTLSPPSSRIRIYLARRRKLSTRAPVRRSASNSGSAQRKSGRRTSARRITRPCNRASRPRMTVSTSGSSGTLAPGRLHPGAWTGRTRAPAFPSRGCRIPTAMPSVSQSAALAAKAAHTNSLESSACASTPANRGAPMMCGTTSSTAPTSRTSTLPWRYEQPETGAGRHGGAQPPFLTEQEVGRLHSRRLGRQSQRWRGEERQEPRPTPREARPARHHAPAQVDRADEQEGIADPDQDVGGHGVGRALDALGRTPQACAWAPRSCPCSCAG